MYLIFLKVLQRLIGASVFADISIFYSTEFKQDLKYHATVARFNSKS